MINELFNLKMDDEQRRVLIKNLGAFLMLTTIISLLSYVFIMTPVLLGAIFVLGVLLYSIGGK